MMPPWQKYACPDCRNERRLPESPTTGPRHVRIGCDRCGAIRRHRAVGRVVTYL